MFKDIDFGNNVQSLIMSYDNETIDAAPNLNRIGKYYV
jgi:hypothetical protein